jgi:hypothetical protein
MQAEELADQVKDRLQTAMVGYAGILSNYSKEALLTENQSVKAARLELLRVVVDNLSETLKALEDAWKVLNGTNTRN